MRPTVIVLPSIVLRDHPCPEPGRVGLLQTREQLAVEQFVSQAAVERFVESVPSPLRASLPGRSRFDAQRAHARLRQPSPQRLGDELRAVVATDVLRRPAHLEKIAQGLDHLRAGEASRHLNAQGLPGVLILEGQELQRSTVRRLVTDKGVAPNMVDVRSAMTNAQPPPSSEVANQEEGPSGKSRKIRG
jgi:hypothetical protein